MPNLKEILKEFVATANAGEYKTEDELLSAFPELKGYDINTLKEFVSTANAGEYTSEDELLAAFPEFGQPVKKKEEPQVLPWNQKPAPPKPKQEPALPFLESKPSGISLGSARVPETAPMFEAPPMRTPEEAQAIVEAPEDGSYIDNLYTNLELGASMFNEAVFSLPETVINLFAVPQNFIAEKTGWNVGTNADKIKETLGITNPLLDWVNEDQKVLSGEVSNYVAKNYDDAGIVSNFQSGNYKDGFELLGSSIAQAVPISVGMMIGGMVASTEVLAATSTLGLTEGQRQELEEMDPTMSESEKTLKALGMSAAESVFSSIGEGTIGKVYRDIAKREGKEAAKGIFKDGLVQTYKTALEKGGMAAGFVGEGIEEAATQITQNVISGRSAFENVADAFATGAGSGVVFTAPISAINAKNYIKNKAETYATKDKIGQVLKDKADNIDNLYNVPVGTEITPEQLEIANLSKSRVLLENNLKKSVKNGKITPNDAKQSLYVFDKIQQVSNSVKDLNVDEQDKAKIATLLSKRNDLANKIKNQDDVLVVQEKQQVEQINKQIEEILLKPKEDAVQKPSTEEGVLRPEEPQVGLQEVGEGDAKEQAPAQEVVKEEVVKEEVVTPDEEVAAALDRIEIPEDTEALPGVDDELKTINESIGRVKEPVSREKDDQVLQDLDDKIAKAKRRIATADDADVAIEEFKQAQKEKADFEETINKKKNFSQVDGLISDEIYFRDRDKGQYEYQELFDQDPRLAALQSAKDMVEFARKNPDENINIENRESDIKILEEDIAKFPVKEAVQPIVTPRNKAERKAAARKGDMVYHNFDGSIIESTREQYDNALKEIAETGAIENVFNYGKEVSSRQAPNELEIQYEPSLLYMKKEDADSDLKRRTKVEEITDKAVEAVSPATPVVEAAPKVSSKTPKAKSVPIPVAIPKPAPKPAPAPAPAPSAVVSQPTTKAVGPVSLQEEYTNKIAEVRFNSDKSRTPKQIDERVKELQAEYKKLKAEMTAPKPKAEAKPTPKKAAAAPKAEPVVKSRFQQAQDFADKLSAMTEEERDDVEFDENYRGYQLFEARKLMPKTSNSPKFKKVNEDNSSTLYNNYEYIANIDGEPYGLVKYEDPDDPDNDKAFIWAYEKVGTDDLFQTLTDDNEELISEIKSQISKEVKATPKAEPTSVVEEDEPSYDDIKDLDPTDETNLKKMLRKFDSMDNELADFGRGNLSSGIAIPLARAIIKSLKVLVKAGIRIEDAIKRLATQNNLEEKDIVKMIKDIDKAQSAMKKLKDQIKAEARSATDAKNDMNQKRKNLSKVISEIEASGKISAFKAQAVINKIGKLNLDSKASVDKFIDYAGKVFADAEYANKLNTAKDTRSQIRKLSKSKEKFANLRDLGSKFAGIDPSMVEDIDEYNEMATLIRDSIKGSTTRKADVKFANMMKESDAMAYINKAMEAQQKMLLSQKQAEVQELLDIDASDLTYDQLMELVNDDKPLTKYNEGLIRAAINKAFRVYSSMIDASMRNSQDVFTEEGVAYTTNQKKVVKEFMSMDLNVLSPKQALESVDALVNFLQNQSIAKMDSVLAKYKGETEMRAIEKKGIKAKPVRKYWSKGLGRLLLEQTANLPIVFERMFGGFTRGGMVEDAMGITALKNGKSKAQSESNKIVDEYVDKFYKLKPNGEVFNTAFNNIERGMVAFMSRSVFGTDSEMKVEFKRRRDLIEQSTKELEKGNEKEVAKAKVYQEVYDKVLKDSDSIEQVQSKAAPENLEAVKFWQDEWADKYEQLYDTALGVYNKILEKDMNYSMPDRYSKLSSDTGEVDITTEDMGFLINSGTAPLYKKETGVLMAATRPESLPKSKGTSKTNRYIDLSFDNTNSNAMYDALVDINTAAPIRQVQSALNSDAFARIMKGTGDEKLIKNRIDLYVRNIRNKNPFSNDEFSKSVKSLNRIASIGVGQALGGVLQPITQVIPIATNTLVNSGNLDVQSTFDPAKQAFMNNSGYAIGNRGVESQAQIESLNKMIEEAASSKPEKAFREIEKANNWWLKNFLVKFDVIIARASWMTYYEQSLKEQGIDPATIDYNTHEINEKAANYAQRQVDRQQNISDPDLAGALLSDKDAGKQLFVKVLMPFASFRMNQSARFGADLATVTNKTATKEDKEIAYRSLFGFAAEMATFRLLSAGSALLIAAAVKGIMGRGDDEEKEKKKNDAIIKGQLTSTVADVFSPAPLIDKAVQMGASAVLDATQDALDVSDEEKLEIYSGNKQDFFQSLGLLGITGSRVSQLYEMSKLAAGASYEDDYGRKKYLSPEDRKAIATLIPIAIASNIGLTPSEVNKIVRSSISDAKRNASTVEGGQSKVDTKIMGLNKEDLKRYYPEVYEEYYGEGTEDAERRKLEQEENKLEREMKDEEYDYKPEDKKSGGFSTGGFGSGK